MKDLNEDDLLVISLRGGDVVAFQKIYSKYNRPLLAFARRNISAIEECEEIIQDLFETLWSRRHSLEVSSLRHYLYSSVRYKIIRHFQHSRVKQKYEEHYRFFEEVYDAVEKEDREDIVLIQERLDRCLNDLPERCQVVFRLRLYENLSNSEIAERMKITKKTVEVYIFKAFSHLRSSYHKIYRTM
jgi:RNA polymerase sigma-70 factor (family 1)